KISITICSKRATIVDITRTKIGFFMPSCDTAGSSTVNVAIGSITDSSLSFTYSSASGPTITSLNTTSSNPALKTILEIHGTGFGNNSNDAKVFLSNATGKIY
ncbi:MAG: IPT/TIG domain-containing protein, partial [Flammeovirgaceae bacterium]